MTWQVGQPPTTIQSLPVSIASSGDNTVIAAPANLPDGTKRTLRIYGLTLVATGAVTVTIKDGANNAQSGAMSLITGTPYILPMGSGLAPTPYHITQAGDAFVINLGGAVQVSGTVWFDVGQ